eukprot:102829-Alexandrium_andersonii.AAC.1
MLQGQLPGSSADALRPLELVRGSVRHHGIQVQLRLGHQRALVVAQELGGTLTFWPNTSCWGLKPPRWKKRFLATHGLHEVREVHQAGDDGGPRVQLAADPLLHPASVSLSSAVLPWASG